MVSLTFKQSAGNMQKKKHILIAHIIAHVGLCFVYLIEFVL